MRFIPVYTTPIQFGLIHKRDVKPGVKLRRLYGSSSGYYFIPKESIGRHNYSSDSVGMKEEFYNVN